jgi:hypothetical protein
MLKNYWYIFWVSYQYVYTVRQNAEFLKVTAGAVCLPLSFGKLVESSWYQMNEGWTASYD